MNTYVPELDGPDPGLYAHWLEPIDAAEDLGFYSGGHGTLLPPL